ncbi:MAG: HEAT repeat domain-containing protein [Candidatus Eiseniibacteriota bacterium]
MDRTGPQAGPKEKADQVREHIFASDAERLEGWAALFIRAVEARRLHSYDDPAVQTSQAELEERTLDCLDQIGDIPITVDEFDLIFTGRTVYHSKTQDGSLAAALHRGGVHEFVIRQGVGLEELRDFVAVMKSALEVVADGPDDVVTLLWERNFRHIGYTSIPLEDPQPKMGKEEPVLPWPWGALEDCDPESGADGRLEGRSDDWHFSAETPRSWDASEASRFALSEVEAENIRMVARLEEANSPQDQVLEILSMVLIAEEDPKAYQEVASIMGRLIEMAIVTGDLARANRLMDVLRGIPTAKGTARGEFAAATDHVVREIGRRDLMVEFAAVLNHKTDVDFDALTTFLVHLGTSAAPTLCDLLGDINDMKMRRALCEALAITCKSNVEILIQRMDDSRWYVVRNLLYVLGRIGHQGVERALGEALYHADVRVRKEAVRALGGIESATSRAYLNSALRDIDRSIRILVAQLVGKRVDERAAQVLWSVIESPEFASRDQEERALFFVALGRSGSDAMVPRLERVLTRGGLFRTEQGGKKEAALALAWIGTPAAIAILNREVKTVREDVRRAVEEALEAVRRASREKPTTG